MLLQDLSLIKIPIEVSVGEKCVCVPEAAVWSWVSSRPVRQSDWQESDPDSTLSGCHAV